MLALLVFNSLEAVLQTQPRETPTGQDSATTKTDGLPLGAGQISGVNGGPGQEMIYQALVDLERLCQSTIQSVQDKDQGEQTVDEADVSKTQSAPAQKTGGFPTDLLRALNQGLKATTPSNTAPHQEGDKRLPKEATEVGTLPPEVSSEGKGSPSAEINLAVGPSATEGTDDKNTLTVAIRTPFGAVGQNGPTEEIADGNSAAKKGFTTEKTDSVVTTIVKDLSPLLKKDGDGPLHDNGGIRNGLQGKTTTHLRQKWTRPGRAESGRNWMARPPASPRPQPPWSGFRRSLNSSGARTVSTISR